MNQKRIRLLNRADSRHGPVIYWMSRDQRADDNWALLFAQELALKKEVPLAVIFCLVPSFLNAAIRQYAFMIEGLKEVEKRLSRKNICFQLLAGYTEKEIPRFIKKNNVSALIADFDPLKIKRQWKKNVYDKVNIPVYEVDAHNIVPCWVVSGKQEYAAYTFRPKIHKALDEFLEGFPTLKKHPFSWKGKKALTNWNSINKRLKVDRKVPAVSWLKPGQSAAKRALNHFLKKKLDSYDKKRNDPTFDAQSNLSPYLHFGHISAQRVALKVLDSTATRRSKDSFLEELIVRRELADNFCFYNKDYDSFKGFPAWGKDTLSRHKKDRRSFLYSMKEFEYAKTHDNLWNAAQMELMNKGKMHGFMRMYWAKKILEWSKSPEKALQIAIYLNDKYELDGRDPNGYTGIAWSIGGVHDRAWNERPIFGKIRYMSYNGCKSKFDVEKYIRINLPPVSDE